MGPLERYAVNVGVGRRPTNCREIKTGSVAAAPIMKRLRLLVAIKRHSIPIRLKLQLSLAVIASAPRPSNARLAFAEMHRADFLAHQRHKKAKSALAHLSRCGLRRFGITCWQGGIRVGSYAFASDPDYVVHIDRNAMAGARWVAGVDEQWNMPAALFDVRGGFDNQTEPDAIRHHTAKWRVSGSQVHARAHGSGIQSDPMGGTSVCLQARGSRARYWASDDLHCAHIYWPDDLIRELATAIHQERGDRADLLLDDTFFSDDVLLARMAEGYLRRALVASDTPTALEMDARSIAFCTHVIIRHSLVAHAFIRKLPSQLTPNQLSRALDLMCMPSDKPVRLRQIAKAAGVSPFHFCRGFQKSTGMAPHQWLINFKIERAKKLLHCGKNSIMDIAAFLNYDDPSYFARLFKKHTGISPRAYKLESRYPSKPT